MIISICILKYGWLNMRAAMELTQKVSTAHCTRRNVHLEMYLYDNRQFNSTIHKWHCHILALIKYQVKFLAVKVFETAKIFLL